MNAARKVYNNVMIWYAEVRRQNNIKKALLAAQLKAEQINQHNDEDDKFKY